MAIQEILASIDREIGELQRARAVLSALVSAPAKRKPGRPRKVAADAPVVSAKAAKKKKRNLTPEGRKRIAEAVKRRWAAQRKATALAQK